MEGWRHTDKASLIEKYGFSVDGAEKLCALLYIYAIAQDIAPFNKQAQ